MDRLKVLRMILLVFAVYGFLITANEVRTALTSFLNHGHPTFFRTPLLLGSDWTKIGAGGRDYGGGEAAVLGLMISGYALFLFRLAKPKAPLGIVILEPLIYVASVVVVWIVFVWIWDPMDMGVHATNFLSPTPFTNWLVLLSALLTLVAAGLGRIQLKIGSVLQLKDWHRVLLLIASLFVFALLVYAVTPTCSSDQLLTQTCPY